MTAVKQNYGEKVIVQVDKNSKHSLCGFWTCVLHLLCLIILNDFFSLKILQITMLLNCLQNMVQLISFSMTIYRYYVLQMPACISWTLLVCSNCLCIFSGDCFCCSCWSCSSPEAHWWYPGWSYIPLPWCWRSKTMICFPPFLYLIIDIYASCYAAEGKGSNRSNAVYCIAYFSILNELVCLTHFWLCFQAGTGIAELIALEMSKQVNQLVIVYVSVTLVSTIHF